MKYNWSKYNLQDRLELLEKLTTKEKDKKNLREIYYSIDIIKEYLTDLDAKKENYASLLENLNANARYYSSHKFLRDDLANFALEEIDENSVGIDLKPLSISKKEILQITHDFYKDQDKEIYRNFLNMYKRRNDHLVFLTSDEDYGDNIIFTVPYLNEAFIRLYKGDDITTILSSIHEFAHATSFSFNNYHCADIGKRFLSETDSLFFELVATDFLRKKYNFGDEYISALQRHDGTIYSTRQIMNVLELTRLHKECSFKDNKRLKNVSYSKLNFSPTYVEDLIATDIIFETPYSIGYLFAVELYELYKFDKEKALHVLKKFIRLNSMQPDGYYRETKRLGLYPNAHMKDYKEDLEYKLTLKK